jgi:hypothetical protein
LLSEPFFYTDAVLKPKKEEALVDRVLVALELADNGLVAVKVVKEEAPEDKEAAKVQDKVEEKDVLVEAARVVLEAEEAEARQALLLLRLLSFNRRSLVNILKCQEHCIPMKKQLLSQK